MTSMPRCSSAPLGTGSSGDGGGVGIGQTLPVVPAGVVTRTAVSPLPEQRQRRREAVHEIGPADRSELPRREQAAEGDRAERAGHGGGVVVGDVEQAGAPSVAGEHQGGVGPPAGQGGSQVVGRRSTASRRANCTVLPSGTRSSTDSAPVARSTPSRGRNRRSPGPGSRTPASTQRPSRSPLPSIPAMSARPRCSAIWSTMHSMAGRPAISRTRFRSTRVTVRRRPKGRHPWESTGTTSVAGPRRTATAPWSTTRSPMARRVPPGPDAPGGVAADDREARAGSAAARRRTRRPGR